MGTRIITPANTSMNKSTSTSDGTSTDTLTTTTSVAITAALIKTTAMITETAKEATFTTNWISQDSVVVGMTFACVVLLILITLMVASCYFIHKNGTVKKDIPTIPS